MALYLIENGEYLTYDSMREENSGNSYVYYKLGTLKEAVSK